MKFYNRKIIFFFMGFMLALLLTSCSSKKIEPDVTVRNFFEAAKKQNLNTMNSLVKKEENKERFKYDDSDKEKLNKAIFSKIAYQILTTKGDEETKVIKVSIVSPDLVRIYSKAINEYSPNSENAGESKNSYLINLINDANSPKISTTVDIKLIKDKGSWIIEPSDELFNAITGNLEKVKDTDKLLISSAKPDSKIYNIGEEAIAGKAAITVSKVEVSTPTEAGYSQFDKENKFIVVYLKERNISEQNVEYQKYQFKIQTSKGEIIKSSEVKFGKDFGSGKLAAGESADGTITFEVPENIGLTLLYCPVSEALLKFKIDNN